MIKPITHTILPLILLLLPLSKSFSQNTSSQNNYQYLNQEHQIYLSPLNETKVRQYHEETIYFYIPATHHTLSQAGLVSNHPVSIENIRLKSVRNLPLGMFWKEESILSGEGQVKLYGTPVQAGYYTLDFDFELLSNEGEFILVQSLDLIVHPEKQGQFFSASPITGCGNLEVIFQTKPFPKHQGIRHFWDFGDGSFSETAKLKSHYYEQAGSYHLKYQVEIDTFGLLLNRMTILDVACVDNKEDFFSRSSKPDLYFVIKDETGQTVFKSLSSFKNTAYPLDLYPELQIGSGSYRVEIWDKQGRKDQFCSDFIFDAHSPSTFQLNGVQVELNFERPIQYHQEEIQIIVAPSIDTPQLEYVNATFCEGSQLQLSSNSSNKIQWFKDGLPISNASTSLFVAEEAGVYEVAAYNDYGCVVYSDIVAAQIAPKPIQAAIIQDKNSLSLSGEGLPTGSYSYEWYLNEVLIEYENAPTLCIYESGHYALKITDENTSCSSISEYLIEYDPSYDCSIPIDEIAHINQSLHVFPSYSRGDYCVNFNINNSENVKITLTDLEGDVVFSEKLNAFEGNYFKVIDIPKTSSKSIYNLEILVDKSRIKRSLLLPY